jgi:hypothetical protein
MNARFVKLFWLILLAVACENKTHESSSSNEHTPDTISAHVDATPVQVYKPPTTKYDSYPQVIQTLFSEGSYMEEVYRILGKPEYIKNDENDIQVWFYGKSEITFTKKMATDVEDKGAFTKHYMTMHELLGSDDYYELRLGRELAQRRMNASRTIEIK